MLFKIIASIMLSICVILVLVSIAGGMGEEVPSRIFGLLGFSLIGALYFFMFISINNHNGLALFSSIFFKVLSWVSIVFFVIVSLIVAFGFGGETPKLASLIFLFGGSVYFLMLFTISEINKFIASISDKLENCGPAIDSTEAIQSLDKKVDKLLALLEGKPSV